MTRKITSAAVVAGLAALIGAAVAGRSDRAVAVPLWAVLVALVAACGAAVVTLAVLIAVKVHGQRCRPALAENTTARARLTRELTRARQDIPVISGRILPPADRPQVTR